MKKAKILIPAVAALVLSSAAAVTGTVAWFTANLTAHVSADTITVVKSGSNLTATGVSEGGFGTSGSGKTISHSKMIDGSVDMVNEKVYKATFDKTGSTCTGFAEGVDGVVPSETLYSATKFFVDLTMDLENEVAGTSYGLYVDPAQLSPKLKSPDGATDAEKALRVGLKCGIEWVVWSPYYSADSHDEETLTYVNSTTYVGSNHTTASTAEYTTAQRIISTDKTVTSHDIGNKLYLGLFERPESLSFAVTKRVTVYTWFEGSKIVNGSSLGAGNYEYTLGFNAVKVIA